MRVNGIGRASLSASAVPEERRVDSPAKGRRNAKSRRLGQRAGRIVGNKVDDHALAQSRNDRRSRVSETEISPHMAETSCSASPASDAGCSCRGAEGTYIAKVVMSICRPVLLRGTTFPNWPTKGQSRINM